MNMNDSQTSEVLFDDSFISCGSPLTHNALSYKSNVVNVKEALNNGLNEIQKPSFPKYFSNLLQDCSACIQQSLELILTFLSDQDTSTITDYLDDAVCILQQLSTFKKSLIESVTLSCSNASKLPTTTAVIIEMVFRHCKDSESLYGTSLRNFEKQLKDLFKNCHELQVSYLMILEKHFIFNLTEQEDKDILVEALEINLRIGELVQSLDVKTMAEQWKAYIVICENYVPYLKETLIYQQCSLVLCALVKNNITSAVENNDNEKLVLRSLKVASFTIKILAKISAIMKQTNTREYQHIFDLLDFIHRYTIHPNVSDKLGRLMHMNVALPTGLLLNELLIDEKFFKNLQQFLKEPQDGDLTAKILIIISVTRCFLQQNSKCATALKHQVVDLVYSSFEYTQFWIKQSNKLNIDPCQSEAHSLFNLMAIHITALVVTMDGEEFSAMEGKMIENILGTDCLKALFSCKVWILLARNITPQLLFNQLIWLCTIFKKLETQKKFNMSPQKVHLSYTLGGLFQAMENEEKLKICKQFRINDDANIVLWTALKVRNLPSEALSMSGDAVVDKLKNCFREFCSGEHSDVDVLINLFKLTETCTFTTNRGLENVIIKAWLKICPIQSGIVKHIDGSTIWFYDYVEGLVRLTEAMLLRMKERGPLVKIMHVVTAITQTGNTDLKSILTNIVFQISTFETEHISQLDSYLTTAFISLLQDEKIKYKVINQLRNKHNRNTERLFRDNDILQEIWCEVTNGSTDLDTEVTDFLYIHKCFSESELSVSAVQEVVKSNSSNFDFDVENLFDNEREEPLSKKVKLDEADRIIKRLENDSSLLCNVKENVFTTEHKRRIKDVCDKLLNLIN